MRLYQHARVTGPAGNPMASETTLWLDIYADQPVGITVKGSAFLVASGFIGSYGVDEAVAGGLYLPMRAFKKPFMALMREEGKAFFEMAALSWQHIEREEVPYGIMAQDSARPPPVTHRKPQILSNRWRITEVADDYLQQMEIMVATRAKRRHLRFWFYALGLISLLWLFTRFWR